MKGTTQAGLDMKYSLLFKLTQEFSKWNKTCVKNHSDIIKGHSVKGIFRYNKLKGVKGSISRKSKTKPDSHYKLSSVFSMIFLRQFMIIAIKYLSLACYI